MAATTTIVVPDPRTAAEVSDDQLLFMTLGSDALGDSYSGFEEVSVAAEDNLTLARKTLQDPSDEADDIATFGRLSGARAELRPRAVRVGTGDVSVLQSWVGLFATDAGAAEYLDDFVQDAAKGIGGGIPSDRPVVAAEEFALDRIGSQSVGLIITEDLGDGAVRYQTVVGIRLGRVLGFVAVAHADDGDRRLRVIRLAEVLADRIGSVVDGDLVPPEPPPVLEDLTAYAFRYSQTVDKAGSKATILSVGVDMVGEALDCRLLFDLDGLNADRHYIVFGDTAAWILDGNAPDPAWEQTTRGAFNTAADLIYCPGWPVELLASGLDVVLAGRPITETTYNDQPAVLYVLDAGAAAAIGFLPEGSGISVDRFEVITDDVNPWTLSLTLRLSGTAVAFAEAFGDEFTEFAGDRVAVAIDFGVSRVNDPELTVIAP